jgi:hypothetical protein
MRLGILESGAATDWSPLIEGLRTKDVDVVTAESPTLSAQTIAQEAARLHRADCDGMVVFVTDALAYSFMTTLTLHITCPLLVASTNLPALCDACGALSALGIPHERLHLRPESNLTEILLQWLKANRKTERQPGMEAAAKLYGQRFSLAETPMVGVDREQWLQQFGILLVSAEAEADVQVPDNDLHTAFCCHLLRLLANTEPLLLPVDVSLPADHTFLQIARRSGRFVGLYGYTTIAEDIGSFPFLSGRLALVPGDRRVALRAACHALDIAL